MLHVHLQIVNDFHNLESTKVLVVAEVLLAVGVKLDESSHD
jgi:hypothetical protein